MSGITIEGTYNARWATPGPEAVPWLARAAALDAVGDAGRAQLAELGIALVLDLREDGELAANTEPKHGVPVTRVALYRLPDGPPASGSLEQVYEFLLTERGAALTEAVAAVADSDGPVLVHCTAGKDRTGLVVALALLAAGHDEADVVADYELSSGVVRARREQIAEATLRPLGLDVDAHGAALRLHLDSPAEAMLHALRTLSALGGAEAYLIRHGLRAEQLQSLRRTLGRPSDD
jgi:protein-tyrosine phosphatase